MYSLKIDDDRLAVYKPNKQIYAFNDENGENGRLQALFDMAGIRYTGTSVNPARSFGPALFIGGDALANVWVFIVAPLVGGVLAAVVYKFLSSEK